MLSLSIQVSFPNLDRRWIELPCPYCRLETAVTLGDVRRCGIAICRGCHANIHLEDHLGCYQRAKRQIEAAFAQLSKIGR